MMKTFFEPDIHIEDLQCQRNDTVQFLHEQLATLISQSGRQDDFMIPNKILADRLKIAPQTLHKVYLQLEDDQLIYREKGKRLWQLNVSSNQVPCLGLILPTAFSVYFPLKSSYGQCHFRMYTGLVERAAELGYAILPLQLPPPDADRQTCLKALKDIKQKCQGIIHLGGRNASADRPLQMLTECKALPQVSLDCTFKHPHISSVSFDAQQTIHLFVDGMRELGHHHFAFIRLASSPDHTPLLSYTLTQPEQIAQFFLNEGVPQENLTIVEYNRKTWSNYYHTILTLLEQENPPTAIFCRNDDIAIELMQIIQEQGYRVPDDISVVGFNDLNEAESSTPPLSTVRNPLLKLGAALADQLHRQIHNKEKSPPAHIRIAPMLVPRASTGPYLKSFENH